MSSLAARRRHPAALLVVLLLGLVLTGGLYAVFAPKNADASATGVASADQISEGKQLFLSNCASCHGTAATGSKAGPSLVGVGAASVDFQVGTGQRQLLPLYDEKNVGQHRQGLTALDDASNQLQGFQQSFALNSEMHGLVPCLVGCDQVVRVRSRFL